MWCGPQAKQTLREGIGEDSLGMKGVRGTSLIVCGVASGVANWVGRMGCWEGRGDCSERDGIGRGDCSGRRGDCSGRS